MREYAIAAIPADGIGPEVISAGLQALSVLERRMGTFRLRVQEFPWGSDFYRKTGAMMPADGLETLKTFDAIYFGAVGAPGIPSVGMLSMVLVLESVGLPTEAIAILLPIDRLLDTVRTAVNVEGDMVGSLVVQKLAGDTPKG